MCQNNHVLFIRWFLSHISSNRKPTNTLLSSIILWCKGRPIHLPKHVCSSFHPMEDRNSLAEHVQPSVIFMSSLLTPVHQTHWALGLNPRGQLCSLLFWDATYDDTALWKTATTGSHACRWLFVHCMTTFSQTGLRANVNCQRFPFFSFSHGPIFVIDK